MIAPKNRVRLTSGRDRGTPRPLQKDAAGPCLPPSRSRGLLAWGNPEVAKGRLPAPAPEARPAGALERGRIPEWQANRGDGGHTHFTSGSLGPVPPGRSQLKVAAICSVTSIHLLPCTMKLAAPAGRLAPTRAENGSPSGAPRPGVERVGRQRGAWGPSPIAAGRTSESHPLRSFQNLRHPSAQDPSRSPPLRSASHPHSQEPDAG